ncbi:hypothetical protein TVAG_395450 [Trichomonas vaginalis G3]|uniref:Sugar phosphate transporter domain-containing protein n=1 Tax=Trichomonas vaginalis (strain ATCC PRA-98 / G3) TaxID=412133 RepID=A2F1D4_TRIV3|nr:carbohydrate transport [Trichomonas vaginalis G3]EAY01298.1 hypothetical protein TVAG_395450 [Trichomonas vaginalis G3]KAI5542828.1 carbohydrate transport [Trichomonas vaginalis G3]|eukprot:XP_001330166.1 hypothetical protein [Trichomonas vaginalis G3]
MAPTSFKINFFTIFSTITSTALVHSLKIIARRIRCKHAATISTYHFLATWCMLELAAFTNNIRRTSNIPIFSRIILAILVISSVFLQNASLQTNSLSFHQLSKAFIIPVILFHNIFVRHFRHKSIEYGSICLAIFGTCVMCITDLQYSIKGMFYSIFGVITTAYSQLLIEDFQRKYQMNGAELQLSVIPYEFISGMIISTLLEATGEGSFMTYDFQLLDLLLFLFTCFLAIWVNVSAFMLIGYTSPLSFQVTNSLKSISILLLSMFANPLGGDNFTQNILTVVGAFLSIVGYIFFINSTSKVIKGNPEEMVPFISDKQ